MVPSSAVGANPSNSNTVICTNNSVISKLNSASCSVLGILSPGTKWIINGRAKFYLLAGDCVSIFGANICPSDCVSHEIFSPSMHLAMDLKIPIQSETAKGFSLENVKDSILKVSGISEDEWLSLVVTLGDKTDELFSSSAVIVLQTLPSRVFDSIEELVRFRGLFTPKTNQGTEITTACIGNGFSIQSASIFDGFIEPPQMERLYQKVVALGNLFL